MDGIIEKRRLASVCVAPQALAWDGDQFWMSSRDLGTLYRIDRSEWKVIDEKMSDKFTGSYFLRTNLVAMRSPLTDSSWVRK